MTDTDLHVAPHADPVAAMFESWSANDLERARGLLAPGAEAWLASAPGGSDTTANPGRAMAATRWLDLLQGVLDQLPGGLQVIVHRRVGDGEWVAAEVESRGTLTDGRLYNMRYTFWFEVHDGRIHQLRQYFDTDYGRQFFLRVAETGP
jgi:ketosteroid isomerase-like protein